jgi:hypothetical protein
MTPDQFIFGALLVFFIIPLYAAILSLFCEWLLFTVSQKKEVEKQYKEWIDNI